MRQTHIFEQPYNGWQHCVWMENDFVRLIVTVDVGPRIICFQTLGGENMLFQFPKQQGSVNASEWLHYGGHRLWHAPQEGERPNQPDNAPVAWCVEGSTLWLDVPMEERTLVQKRMELTLAPDAPRVHIRHKIYNRGLWPVELSAWAMTIMHAGGVEVLPVSQLDTHYLPNYMISFWPWTRPNDPRFTWGERYFTLRHDPTDEHWFKIGYRNTEGWGAYFCGGCMFLKISPERSGKRYPDYGSTFETYADQNFIELESIGPLERLDPNGCTTHDEVWYLLPDIATPAGEDDFARRIAPRIAEILTEETQQG